MTRGKPRGHHVLSALVVVLVAGGALAAPPVPPPSDTNDTALPSRTPPSPPSSPSTPDPTPPDPSTGSDVPPSSSLSEPSSSSEETSEASSEEGAADVPAPKGEEVTEGTPVATSGPSPEATAPLNPNAQAPSSVQLEDGPMPKARALDLGAFAGISNRPAEGEGITYGPAVAWGIYARIELRRWLGLRLYYREESIPVTVERGAFDTSTSFGDTDFDQPNLKLRSLGARLEPTWVVAPRLHVMAVIGASWLRFVAPPATSTGTFDVRTADRSAVELDFQGGVGAAFELLPDWLTVGAQLTYGVSTQRSGTAYEDVQAFSDGKRYTLGPLPRFDGVTDLLFSVGLLL